MGATNGLVGDDTDISVPMSKRKRNVDEVLFCQFREFLQILKSIATFLELFRETMMMSSASWIGHPFLRLSLLSFLLLSLGCTVPTRLNPLNLTNAPTSSEIYQA